MNKENVPPNGDDLPPPPMPCKLERSVTGAPPNSPYIGVAEFPPNSHQWRPLAPTAKESGDADGDEVRRYLNFVCTNRHSPYKDKTWGWILENDYAAYVDLLSKYVRSNSRTFAILSKCLRSQEDYNRASLASFFYDTHDGQEEELARYLDFKCNHKGRMNGKTWGEIFHHHPDYFEWAVRNAMGRNTRTFQVLVKVFSQEKQDDIMRTPRVVKRP
jgi:hypothetical protein